MEIWDHLKSWLHRKEAEKYTTNNEGKTAVRTTSVIANSVGDEASVENDSLLVQVSNPSGQPIPVYLTSGTPISEFDETLSVPVSSISTVVTYTVPASKVFSLYLIEGSGTSLGEYTVLSGVTVIGKRRTSHGAYDFISEFGGCEFAAGTVIKLNINNASSSSNDFSGKIVGSLKDV